MIYILSYSHIAGRNFSWMSQTLWSVRLDLELGSGLVAAMICSLVKASRTLDEE